MMNRNGNRPPHSIQHSAFIIQHSLPGGPVPILLRHANLRFRDQVIYLTGHAYERCQFTRCTFVVQGTGTTALVQCEFEACVWHLDVMLYEGEQLADFERTLLPMIRASLPQPPTADQAGAGAGPG